MAQNSSNRMRTLSTNLFKKSPSAQQLREEVRKQFKEKLKLGRNNELYKRRDIFKSIISDVQKNFSEIQGSLLEGNEVELMDTEGILRVIMDVERELYQNVSQKQVEEYELQLQEETNAFLENFCLCNICNKFIDFQNISVNVICDQCAQLHFNDETL